MAAPLKLGVSYFGNRIPWRVKEDLEVIHKAGCDYVVLTFSEEDREFYQGAFAEIIQDAHQLGLEVWLDPWGVGQAFGGETYSNLIAQDLSIRQVNSQGESLPIACPLNPDFREYLLVWIKTAARLKADLLFWDEPHFMIYPEPSTDAVVELWACRCSWCQKGFEKMAGKPIPKQLTAEVRRFKEESLVECVKFLCDATVAHNLKAGVCVLPFENSSTVNEWAKVAALPSVSVFGTDPYWQPRQKDVDAFVGAAARRVKKLANRFGKEAQLWILNFKIPKGEEDSVRVALEAGYREGIRNFAAWSYFGASYINIRSEDPAAVWKTFIESCQNLRKRAGAR